MFKLLLFFCTLTFSVVCVSSDYRVRSRDSRYCCSDNPRIEFEQQCEVTWKMNTQTFGYCNGDTVGCAPPCKKVEGGVMVLDGCHQVKAEVFCSNGSAVLKEEMVYYDHQLCPSAASAPAGNGWAAFLLLSVGWFLKEWIC